MHVVIVGGSDAGISAALRARELDPGVEVTVVVADTFPNFSICGIPYYLSGDVVDWRHLAHRSVADLTAAGLDLRLETTARGIDPGAHSLVVTGPTGGEEVMSYDALVVATGATPIRPPIVGLAGEGGLGAADGVHLLHSMGDAFSVGDSVQRFRDGRAVIVGGGYVGLEMAEAFVARGLRVTQIEQLPEVLPTVDAALGARVHAHLVEHGVEVLTGTTVTGIVRAAGTLTGLFGGGAGPGPRQGQARGGAGPGPRQGQARGGAGPGPRPGQARGGGGPSPLRVHARTVDGASVVRPADVVLVSVGVRPDAALAAAAGAPLGARGAIAVDRGMRAGLPDVFAAGDCAVTYHRLLGDTYLPLGTTAHKQGRVAGENAVGGDRRYAGSLGTQVVKIFDQVAARTGLRDAEAADAGYAPFTVSSSSDDHNAYYPGAHRIETRCTGDRHTGLLLGVQLFGHRLSEVAKRIDVAATALHHGITVDDVGDLDLSYTPPLGTPWDAWQRGAQDWVTAAGAAAPPAGGFAPAAPVTRPDTTTRESS